MNEIAGDRIAVVIVNYNSGEFSAAHIDRLSVELPGAEIVVVDNASPDASGALIESRVRARPGAGRARYMLLPTNGGYSAGNNAAIRLLLGSGDPPEFFVFLNPDTVPEPGAVRGLCDFLAASPRAGIAGAQLLRPDGSVKCRTAHPFPTPLRDLERVLFSHQVFAKVLRLVRGPAPIVGLPAETDWISGAAFAVRREVFEQIGLFDDEFFLYFEDVDFCRRAKLGGWEVWHLPNCRVGHVGGASTGASFETGKRPKTWHESRRRYYLKHHGRDGRILSDLVRLLGNMPRQLSNRARH